MRTKEAKITTDVTMNWTDAMPYLGKTNINWTIANIQSYLFDTTDDPYIRE
jgi:sensor domain CHASE-containing protein